MAFDNLRKTQEKTASDLYKTYSSASLPQSLLFSGPRGSSRLTGALDLSFLILDDEKNRDLLKTNQIVFLPSRNLELEISAGLTLFERQRNDYSRLFLIQSLRKLLFAYHSSLADVYDGNVSSYFSNASEIGAMIYDYEESREYSEKEIKNLCSQVREKLKANMSSKGKRKASISIDEIRGIQEWFSSGSDEKIAILENVEASSEGTKNSLLKILEEPEEHCHIILISSNPQRLLQTILSRVRRFTFPALSENTVASFISQNFHTDEKFYSFESFFFNESSSDEDKEILNKSVELVKTGIIKKQSLKRDEKEWLFSSLDKINSYKYFYERLSFALESAMLSLEVRACDAGSVMKIINRWINSSDIFNLSQRSTLDGILREVQNVK